MESYGSGFAAVVEVEGGSLVLAVGGKMTSAKVCSHCMICFGLSLENVTEIQLDGGVSRIQWPLS